MKTTDQVQCKYQKAQFQEGISTKAVRGGYIPGEELDQSLPLHLTAAYHYESAERADEIYGVHREHIPGNDYSRTFNPTTRTLERKFALLEKTESALACSSGIQAIFLSLCQICSTGDHIVSSKNIYGVTLRFFEDTLQRFGISYTLVDPLDIAEWRKATTPKTKAYFFETPANPTLEIIDIEAITNLAKEHRITTVADSTLITPVGCNPSDFGTDVIVHSGTKFLDGQGRTVSGIVCGTQKFIDSVRAGTLRTVGGCISPFNAWVLSKSLETLPLRIERHSENALQVAKFLESHPKIQTVLYPFLSSHPQYTIAKKQQRYGGALVSFYLSEGLSASQSFVDNLSLVSFMGNLGDTASIITIPSRTSHARVSQKHRDATNITDGLIRLSTGIENKDDIIADIEHALSFV